METHTPNGQIPASEPTSAFEDILAFLKLLPARIKGLLILIKEKFKAFITLLSRLVTKLSKGPKSTQRQTTEATVGETYLGLTSDGLAYGEGRSEAEASEEPTPPVCPTCHQPTDHAHQPEPEIVFPKITRKNFYKHPIFWARFLGYAIPISFLLYVLYLNYLPFGYHKTFTINVGSPNDTTPSEFYLEPSKDLSDRMTNPDGSTYRTLNGMATAVFKPKAVLKDAKITVEINGDDGISIIPPHIDFDPNSVKWDHAWDFTKGVPKDLTNINNKACAHENGTYFDGAARVEMPKPDSLFENEPFSVYATWTPSDDIDSSQQIVGHFNWEIWQNARSVQFQIGRTNNATGLIYTLKYSINDSFFNKQHSLVAVYAPSDSNGYIELYVDGQFAGRTYIGNNKIWSKYGTNNLSFGWTPHNYEKNPYFKGYLYRVYIASKNILLENKFKKLNINSSGENLTFSIDSNKNSSINQMRLDVYKK